MSFEEKKPDDHIKKGFLDANYGNPTDKMAGAFIDLDEEVDTADVEDEVEALMSEVDETYYGPMLAKHTAEHEEHPVKVKGDLDVEKIEGVRLKAAAVIINNTDPVIKEGIKTPITIALLRKLHKSPPILKSDIENDKDRKKFEEAIEMAKGQFEALGVPSEIVGIFEFESAEEARVVINMLYGYMPEGTVDPEGVEDEEVEGDEEESDIEIARPRRREGQFDRLDTPELHNSGILGIPEEDVTAITNEKVRLAALFLREEINKEDMERIVEATKVRIGITEQIDTRIELKVGTALHGDIDAFRISWNQFYKEYPDLQFEEDEIDLVRDVVNLFTGKTPEMTSHAEIEDTREAAFYRENIEPPDPEEVEDEDGGESDGGGSGGSGGSGGGSGGGGETPSDPEDDDDSDEDEEDDDEDTIPPEEEGEAERQRREQLERKRREQEEARRHKESERSGGDEDEEEDDDEDFVPPEAESEDVPFED